ncbi:GRB2-associated-binding protein 2 [Sciurus carolinensis]|uniref:GRB2-associated-binding protein 2 n=1 Tax=Sciurus carolinensis TaxID=30640 RepID=A0AA41N6P5_SCICA|nr:GRB2-associated-binding protein 2 [Sciurus carolinensis]
MKKDEFAKFGINNNDQQKILAAVKELEVEEIHFGELSEVAKFEVRSDNFSQDARNLFLVRSNIATQTFAQGYDPYVCRIHGQSKASLSHLSYTGSGLGHHSCSFGQNMASKSHTRGSPTGSETDCDDPYISMAHTKTPLSAFQIPKTSIIDKNQSTVVAAASVYKAMATPYKPQTKSCKNTSTKVPFTRPYGHEEGYISIFFCHYALVQELICSGQQPPSLRSVLTLVKTRGEGVFFPDICKHFLRVTESAGFSTESRSLGDSFHWAAESDVGHLDEAGSEDEYMPMSTLPSILLAMERAGGNAQIILNPRSPGSPHFVPPSCSPAALLLHKGLIRGSKIPPPTVDHNLKPGRKGKCTLSLFHLLAISRLCFLYQLSEESWSWG